MQKDIVFIDTSVYVKEKYFSEGNAICTLFKLAKEGIISIVSTDITNQEVLRHMRNDCLEAFSKLKKQCIVLKNISIYKNSFDRTNKTVVEKEVKEILEKNMKTAGVFSLGYQLEESDVKNIFYSYFKEKTPFSGHKKSEFPDAFVLKLLENYAYNNRLSIIVLSVDDDMQKYDSYRLYTADYKEFINEKKVVKEKLDSIKSALDEQYDKICSEIQSKCEESLDDTNLYIYSVEGVDISFVTVNYVHVNFDKDSFYIYNEEEGAVGVEVECDIEFSVDVEYESTSNAYYDSEDKKWYGTESESVTIRKSANCYVDLKYDEQFGLSIEDFDVDDVLREI
ncbi:MAG: DUF4935 domain-containing protein [Aeriscardovia sp.]|nr:DUF4935 domain-containing protein [Aeriscardovia sp.]